MTITFQNYTRKAPDIEVLKIADLNETADWLELNLPAGWTVNRSVVQYGTLLYGNSGGNISLKVGDCLVVDSNEKIIKMTQEQVDMFYDLVP